MQLFNFVFFYLFIYYYYCVSVLCCSLCTIRCKNNTYSIKKRIVNIHVMIERQCWIYCNNDYGLFNAHANLTYLDSCCDRSQAKQYPDYRWHCRGHICGPGRRSIRQDRRRSVALMFDSVYTTKIRSRIMHLCGGSLWQFWWSVVSTDRL